MSQSLELKVEKVHQLLQEMDKVIVAYSGGIDSTLVLKMAHDVLGENALGITAISASMPEREQEESVSIARQIGARLELITSDETDDARYLANAPDRCFFCKSNVYDHMVVYAQEHGYDAILDGTNADDAGDHRPGRQAAREHGVRSPLLEAGITKEEIRELGRQYGLPNWDKPAAACLSSRVPYGTMISIPMLGQIDHAEQTLRDLGFRQLRVRHHDQIARIEVEAQDLPKVLEKRDQIVTRFKELGYLYVTLDLAGFRSGSMNEVLQTDGYRTTA